MRRRSDRYAMNLPADVFVDGKKHAVALHDLSRTGMFVRATDDVTMSMSVGSVVHVALAADGHRVVAAARVTHALTAADARALGRYAGIGLELCEPSRPTDHQFGETIAKLVESCARRVPVVNRRIVVADPETRMLERLSVALGEAGFSVATATNGMEALSACMRKAPDVVLLARNMPVVDGFRALAEIQRHPRLMGVPVIITSDDPADLVQAFELGAMDFIARPFSSLEVVLRARRLAHVVAAGTDLDLDAPDTVVAPLSPESDITARYTAVAVDAAPRDIRAVTTAEFAAESGTPTMFDAVAAAPRVPIAVDILTPLPSAAYTSSPTSSLQALTRPQAFAGGTMPPLRARDPIDSAYDEYTASAPVAIPTVTPDRIMIRGDLSLLPLPSLLVLVEQERKSGRLVLQRGALQAIVEILDGRVVRATGPLIANETRAILMSVLDWTDGDFTLYATKPAPASRVDIALTHLLLEHARIRDEEAEQSRRRPN